jgi:hypothetical protein
MPDINWDDIAEFDQYLDALVSAEYLEQPLAQDWARVTKVCEESGKGA